MFLHVFLPCAGDSFDILSLEMQEVASQVLEQEELQALSLDVGKRISPFCTKRWWFPRPSSQRKGVREVHRIFPGRPGANVFAMCFAS